MKGQWIHQVEMDLSWGRFNFCACVSDIVHACAEDQRDGLVICAPHCWGWCGVIMLEPPELTAVVTNTGNANYCSRVLLVSTHPWWVSTVVIIKSGVILLELSRAIYPIINNTKGRSGGAEVSIVTSQPEGHGFCSFLCGGCTLSPCLCPASGGKANWCL